MRAARVFLGLKNTDQVNVAKNSVSIRVEQTAHQAFWQTLSVRISVKPVGLQSLAVEKAVNAMALEQEGRVKHKLVHTRLNLTK